MVDNNTVEDFLPSEFTGLADKNVQELGEEFKCLHTRNEYDYLMEKLTGRIAEHGYDSYTQKIYSDILSVFSTVFGTKKTDDFPESLNESNQDKAFEKLNAIAGDLKTQEDNDKEFIERLKEIYSKNNYKKSTDYVRRLVIRRLRKISPEFVCVRSGDDYEIVREGKHKGEPALLPDIDDEKKYPTKLLILKQFIKQFGWSDGLVGDDDHGRGYRCGALKDIIENNFDGDWQKAAENIGASIFDELKSAPNRSLLTIAENMEMGKFGCRSRTREHLYVFAIAFEMRWHEQAVGDDDIRKNLFFDYYSENLIYDVFKWDNWESDISGYGINYKNFIEICFLYSIERDIDEPDKLEAAHNSEALFRFQRAMRMIHICRNNKGAKAEEDFERDYPSELYAKSFRKLLINKNENSAVAFIENNYVCRFEREEEYECLLEENEEDLAKIKKLLCAQERSLSLSKKDDGFTYTYTDVSVFDDRNDNEKLIMERLENEGKLLETDTRFHVPYSPAKNTHFRKYSENVVLDKRNKDDRIIIDAIIKDRRRLSEDQFFYDGWQPNDRESSVNVWVKVIDNPVVTDLNFSAANRTAGKLYEKCNNEENREISLDQFIGPVYNTESKRTNADILSLTQIKQKIKAEAPMYIENGESVPKQLYDEFGIILFAFDAKLRQEQAMLNRIFGRIIEDFPHDESDWIVKRSEIMISCFRKIISDIVKMNDVEQRSLLLSFGSFYEHACREMNEKLINCGFMEIDSKSIFDLLLCYSAYKCASKHIYENK